MDYEIMMNGNVKIGMQAPDFEAETTMGKISLNQYRGKWVVLFSHPGDFTPVWAYNLGKYQFSFSNKVNAVTISDDGKYTLILECSYETDANIVLILNANGGKINDKESNSDYIGGSNSGTTMSLLPYMPVREGYIFQMMK